MLSKCSPKTRIEKKFAKYLLTETDFDLAKSDLKKSVKYKVFIVDAETSNLIWAQKESYSVFLLFLDELKIRISFSQRFKRDAIGIESSLYSGCLKLLFSTGFKYSHIEGDVFNMFLLRKGTYEMKISEGVAVETLVSEVKEDILISETKVSEDMWESFMDYNPKSISWMVKELVDCSEDEDEDEDDYDDDDDDDDDDDGDDDDDDDDSRYNPMSESENVPDWRLVAINGISVFDAMFFCNELSKYFDLEPYYILPDPRDFTKYYSEIHRYCEESDEEQEDQNELSVEDSLAKPRNSKIGIDPSANGFRLPTTSEWLASMGSTNPITEDDIKYEISARYDFLNSYYGCLDTSKHVMMRCSRKNELGLYDMISPLVEYCMDPPDSYIKDVEKDGYNYEYRNNAELNKKIFYFSEPLTRQSLQDLKKLSLSKPKLAGATEDGKLSHESIWIEGDHNYEEFTSDLLKFSFRLVRNIGDD